MSFNGLEYTKQVARRLVLEFQDAGHAGTPGLIGSARETSARKQLERLLPAGMGVGSGIVIDSYGGASKQQDIVIYEKHICPIFTYNETPEATFYPVEGVIAVGEIKSSLDGAKLKDATSKIVSAKNLKRRIVAENDGLGPLVPYRHYGSVGVFSAVESDQYSQATRHFDQVFGFILCGNSNLQMATLLSQVSENWGANKKEVVPNLVTSLADGFISWHQTEGNSLTLSAMTANGLVFINNSDIAFWHLIKSVRNYILSGRTVATRHFEAYFEASDARYIITQHQPMY